MSTDVTPEQAAELSDFFSLLLLEHTVEESATAIVEMWPEIRDEGPLLW